VVETAGRGRVVGIRVEKKRERERVGAAERRAFGLQQPRIA
jgi:hypothetical protein